MDSSAFKQPRAYRSVILAAPFHQTNIDFKAAALAPVPEQPYVHLHVTLLSTSSPSPNATYFNLAPGTKAPTTLLTTYEGVRVRGGAEPEFNSLTYHGPVRGQDGEARVNVFGDKEWVVKIFSKARLSDEWLETLFEGKVGWVLRKEWDAYPVLPPTIEFPPVKLAEGLYYVNAFEPYVTSHLLCTTRADDLHLQAYLDHGDRDNRVPERRRPALAGAVQRLHLQAISRHGPRRGCSRPQS